MALRVARAGDGIPQAISHRRCQPYRGDGVGEGRGRFDADDVYVTRCQWPSCGPRLWPGKSPHRSG
jgi:hypothetical protein